MGRVSATADAGAAPPVHLIRMPRCLTAGSPGVLHRRSVQEVRVQSERSGKDRARLAVRVCLPVSSIDSHHQNRASVEWSRRGIFWRPVQATRSRTSECGQAAQTDCPSAYPRRSSTKLRRQTQRPSPCADKPERTSNRCPTALTPNWSASRAAGRSSDGSSSCAGQRKPALGYSQLDCMVLAMPVSARLSTASHP
jgi:hypothetical protein